MTPDWLVQGVLTKLGDAFDRLLGRGWKPSSSLATSELIERLKALLDAEARVNGDQRRFVPHNIKLKMQWDKFSTDSEQALKRLETELLTATIDHINDKRYYTYAPLSLQVKPDYFTEGVKLFVSFDGGDDEREAQIDMATGPSNDDSSVEHPASAETVIARFNLAGENKEKKLNLEAGKRLSVGRTKENDLALGDASVSKIHASLMLNREGALVVADTGSTNGTFIDGERIPYGKARALASGHKVKFGDVAVELEFLPKPAAPAADAEVPTTETYTVGDFEFTKRLETGSNDLNETAQPADNHLNKEVVVEKTGDAAEQTQ